MRSNQILDLVLDCPCIFSARFDNIKKLSLESINKLASDYGKEPRKSDRKVRAKVVELKDRKRHVSAAKSQEGKAGRKRKIEELERETFPWPSQSTPSNSQAQNQNQSQGVYIEISKLLKPETGCKIFRLLKHTFYSLIIVSRTHYSLLQIGVLIHTYEMKWQ